MIDQFDEIDDVADMHLDIYRDLREDHPPKKAFAIWFKEHFEDNLQRD